MLLHAAVIASVALSAALLSGQQSTGSRFLFVWAGDADRVESDFLAVVDISPASATYGQVLRTIPVNRTGVNPHHTEHRYSPGHPLFANDFGGNRTFRFDLSNPLAPALLGEVQASAVLAFPHSFERLPSGNVLATMQAKDARYGPPGGLAEIDDAGRVIRTSSAAAGVATDVETLRPYSLLVLPDKDRVVTASGRMGLPEWNPMRAQVEHNHAGFHAQLWRLSDLKLLKTVALPPVPSGTHLQPSEPRRLANGEILLSTMRCGLFRITGLDVETFGARQVHEFGAFTGPGCAGVPIVLGNFWVQAVPPLRQVVALDASDPERPRPVSSLQLDARQWPHWLAIDPGSNRIVVVNAGTGETRIWMLVIDSRTGKLAIDESFRDPGSTQPGINFDRLEWPHGKSGKAIPHGTVFGN